MLGASLLLTQSGCQNPGLVMYRTEAVIIPSVNSVMLGWHDYVVAGHATQTQVDAVKKAYNTYRDAQLIAKAALEKYIADPTKEGEVAAANAAVSAAKNALIDLVAGYLKI